jgi:hypothetical protein
MPVLHIADLHTPMLPAMARAGVVAVWPPTVEVAPEPLPITVDPTPHGPESAVSMGAILKAGTPVEPTISLERLIRVLPATYEAPARGIRPCVQEFIKRVIVPILVQRFITQRNRGTLSAHTGETL